MAMASLYAYIEAVLKAIVAVEGKGLLELITNLNYL